MDDEYEVDVRTLQRDLERLESEFQLRSEAEGRTKRWCWGKDQTLLQIPSLTGSSAIALLLMRDYVAQLLPKAAIHELEPYFSSAQEALNGSKLEQWRKRVRMIGNGPMLRAPNVEPAVRDVVYEALLDGRQLEADYQSAGAEEIQRFTINPAALVSKDGVLYLVATLWNYDQPRQLALHRMARPKLLDVTAKIPRSFDLHSYIEEDSEFAYPVEPGKIKLVALVSSWMAGHIRERRLAEDQELQARDDGRFVLRATVADTQELRWWLLSLGDQVEVQKPVKLRREFEATASRLAEKYK